MNVHFSSPCPDRDRLKPVEMFRLYSQLHTAQPEITLENKNSTVVCYSPSHKQHCRMLLSITQTALSEITLNHAGNQTSIYRTNRSNLLSYGFCSEHHYFDLKRYTQAEQCNYSGQRSTCQDSYLSARTGSTTSAVFVQRFSHFRTDEKCNYTGS